MVQHGTTVTHECKTISCHETDLCPSFQSALEMQVAPGKASPPQSRPRLRRSELKPLLVQHCKLEQNILYMDDSREQAKRPLIPSPRSMKIVWCALMRTDSTTAKKRPILQRTKFQTGSPYGRVLCFHRLHRGKQTSSEAMCHLQSKVLYAGTAVMSMTNCLRQSGPN